MKLAQRRAWRLFTLLVVAGGEATLSAHEIVVPQVVEMRLAPQGDALVVGLKVPAAVAGDSSLTGLLKGGDTATLEEHLRLVAADIARNLDMQEGETTLPQPAATVRRAPDGAAIEVELRYPYRLDAGGLSARLNAFSSKDGPVRTDARYQPRSGREQVVRITGPAVRVEFDPPTLAALSTLAIRGLHALFEGGDHLLFLVCLLLPMRRPRSAATLYAAAGLAQGVVIALYVVRAPMMAPGLSGAAMAAASVIAIAALQNVARARMRWVVPLAIGFGVLSGWTFGSTAEASVQFAGAHRLAAMLAFGLVVLVGQLWLGAITLALRTWLDERGLPDRVVAIVGSAMVAHSAVHRVMARAPGVAGNGWLGGERGVEWLTLAWVGAILLAAAVNAASGTPARAHSS